jgi:hypothetical protein
VLLEGAILEKLAVEVDIHLLVALLLAAVRVQQQERIAVAQERIDLLVELRPRLVEDLLRDDALLRDQLVLARLADGYPDILLDLNNSLDHGLALKPPVLQRVDLGTALRGIARLPL